MCILVLKYVLCPRKHIHTQREKKTITLALVGPTVLYIKVVPVRKFTELKIKSGLSDMIRSLLLKCLIVFNSILNLELLNFSVKMYKCKKTNQ